MNEAIFSNQQEYNSLIESAKQSRLHYQETGLHITHEEFSAWVQTIQKTPETLLPMCHT